MNFVHLIVAFKKTSFCSFVENIVQDFIINAAVGSSGPNISKIDCSNFVFRIYQVTIGYNLQQSIFIFLKACSLEQLMGQCTSHRQHSQNKTRSDSTQKSYKIQDFKLLKLVGKGGFSRVWKALQKKSGKIYALKVMSKAKIIAKKSVRAVLLERIILSKLTEGENDGVVSMLASFQDDNHLYILMDYLEGQSLRSHLNSGITPSHHQIRSFIYALLQTLQTLYQHRVVHRDIKPQNILFNKEGQPFLTDFGIASYDEEEISDINSGTVGYMAPEVMQSQTHSFTADYYAIGIITFQLFFKKRPYNSINKEDMVKEMVKHPVNVDNFPQLKDIPTEACDFIVKLLQRKARLRLGHEQGIVDLLEHPWFSCMDSDSSDRIQLNYIKFPLSETQDNVSIEDTLQSANTQMNEEKITKILHREHVQEMFKGFNSQTSLETIQHKRRMSDKIDPFSTPVSLKRIATAFT